MKITTMTIKKMTNSSLTLFQERKKCIGIYVCSFGHIYKGLPRYVFTQLKILTRCLHPFMLPMSNEKYVQVLSVLSPDLPTPLAQFKSPQDNYLSTETHAERIPNTRVSSPLIKINMKDHPHVVSQVLQPIKT